MDQKLRRKCIDMGNGHSKTVKLAQLFPLNAALRKQLWANADVPVPHWGPTASPWAWSFRAGGAEAFPSPSQLLPHEGPEDEQTLGLVPPGTHRLPQG